MHNRKIPTFTVRSLLTTVDPEIFPARIPESGIKRHRFEEFE